MELKFDKSKEDFSEALGLDKEKMELSVDAIQKIMDDESKNQYDFIEKAIELASTPEELVFLIHGCGMSAGVEHICSACPMASAHAKK